MRHSRLLWGHSIRKKYIQKHWICRNHPYPQQSLLQYFSNFNIYHTHCSKNGKKNILDFFISKTFSGLFHSNNNNKKYFSFWGNLCDFSQLHFFLYLLHMYSVVWLQRCIFRKLIHKIFSHLSLFLSLRYASAFFT